ncbi:flagellar motor stator protein MotA [Rubrivivax gelatinosus]|uniref:Flagellar motor stator protein MotA n=1 Tax=Rubrivivax gelatinosus TaxID=28068 RepID=A0ABS1E452_RUBGE|nr:flagellar motor stator protein MotA [Rubrivivax gelatinosus]MBK1616485.1 flagellar motor stator protein MotA [Rubrivivax gelatinosus]MBK1715697.1 flagellar motor stator protein MotA [Rubrivivax gelatinosus]
MQSIVGVLIILVCVFGGFMLHGGRFAVIWEPVELLIIVGAGAGAIVLGNPRHVLSEMGLQLRKVMLRRKLGEEFHRQLLLLMYELLQTAAGGLKALDAHVEAPHESALFQRYPLILHEPKLLHFIVDNFRLMAMGKINAHELEGVLDQELEAIHEEMAQPARSLAKIGEAMPGFGILAAVLGIVMAMNTVADGASTGDIAVSVASAMVGTFIGIFLCYGVLDPISNMMKQLVDEELSALESVKVVLVTHVGGKPPLLAIDAGRRLVQLNAKPSFARLESWIDKMQSAGDPAATPQRRAGDKRAQQA